MDSNYLGRNNLNDRIVKSRSNVLCYYSGDDTEYINLGGASSELVGGKLLSRILKGATQYLNDNVRRMEEDKDHFPLSLHTSIGLTPYLQNFIHAIRSHLPKAWVDTNDWCISLQIEGSSAVFACIDLLYQQQRLCYTNYDKKYIGVGKSSYHGPKSTAFGSNSSKEKYMRLNQIFYPVPNIKYKYSKETINEFYTRIEQLQTNFFEKHGNTLSVIIIEPQWGSAGCGQIWPKYLLQNFVKKAHEHNILVCSDEIMCGLGRHGQGKMFLADSWDIEVDAFIFGKSIANGAFPLSGVVIKNGRELFHKNKLGPKQSYTYSHGAHMLSLITATMVLRSLKDLFSEIKEREGIIRSEVEKLSKHQYIQIFGQGLLWGVYINYKKISIDTDNLRHRLRKRGVIVYCITDGLLITPIYNSDTNLLRIGMNHLITVLNDIIHEQKS